MTTQVQNLALRYNMRQVNTDKLINVRLMICNIIKLLSFKKISLSLL